MADDNNLLFHFGKPVDAADAYEVHEHISPVSMYVKILMILFVLTGLTYAVSFLDLGPASLVVAMLVALVKATFVATYFMHLKYDDRYHVFVFLSTLLFVGIFFTFIIFDLQSRPRLNEEQDTFFQQNYDPAVGMQSAQPGLGEGLVPALPKGATAAPAAAAAPAGSNAPADGKAPAAPAGH